MPERPPWSSQTRAAWHIASPAPERFESRLRDGRTPSGPPRTAARTALDGGEPAYGIPLSGLSLQLKARWWNEWISSRGMSIFETESMYDATRNCRRPAPVMARYDIRDQERIP